MLIYICLVALGVITFLISLRLDKISKFVGYKKPKKGGKDAEKTEQTYDTKNS